jgi:hypothetical protein
MPLRWKGSKSIQQTANDVDDVKLSSSTDLNADSADYGPFPILSGKQSRESIHKWLSPPDGPFDESQYYM